MSRALHKSAQGQALIERVRALLEERPEGWEQHELIRAAGIARLSGAHDRDRLRTVLSYLSVEKSTRYRVRLGPISTIRLAKSASDTPSPAEATAKREAAQQTARQSNRRPLPVEGGPALTRSECYSDTAVLELRPPPVRICALHRALEREQAAVAAWHRMPAESRTPAAMETIRQDLERADRDHAAAEAAAQAEDVRRLAAIRIRRRCPDESLEWE